MKWECPNCGATANKCGRKGAKAMSGLAVHDLDHNPEICMGLICECSSEGDDPDHGETFSHPCSEAICYHCGWVGEMPQKPKRLLPWERKALDAGWEPPPGWLAAHKKEKT
jgi:hypothetical protein